MLSFDFQYEGGSPIWLRVGSSSQGSYCLKAFKLGNELFSVDFSFPSKMSNFASTRGLDGLKRPEKYQDVVLSLPSYVSGAVWVAVSNKKGMTVAERMIFVNCARRYNATDCGTCTVLCCTLTFIG